MILTKSLSKLYAATIDRSNFREAASRIIVFVLPLFYFGREPHWAALPIVALGVFLRGWAAGTLKKDQELASTGPYLLVRHPLYLGSCLLSAGFIVALHHWFVTLVIGGITFLTYRHRIVYEDKMLSAHFGDPYRQYMATTRAVLPTPRSIGAFVGALKKPSGFSFSQYLKNKEYECLLGVVVVFAILYVGFWVQR